MELALALVEFLPAWGFLAANIVSPGPNVLTTISLSIGSGRRAGLGAAMGVGVGIALWCLSTTLGLAALLAYAPAIQPALTLAAIGLLIWFSWRYLCSALIGWQNRSQTISAKTEGFGLAAGFRRAMLINLLNPKAMTSWLAILGLFPLARASGQDVMLLCLGACVLSFSIHSIYALAFSTATAARVWLTMSWLLQGLAGILFASFALRLALVD